MNQSKDDILKVLQETSHLMEEAFAQLEKEQEDYWNSLSHDEQLKAFCAVVRRLYDGWLVKDQSYRGMLYDTFGFGMEAYSQAQDAGFLELHNAIESDKAGTYASRRGKMWEPDKR